MRARTWIVGAVAAMVAVGPSTLAYGASMAETAPAPVKSLGVPLPVSYFSAIELDEARGRLYVGQSIGHDLPLAVTDLDGRLLSHVDAVKDVTDVTLSDDGRTLFAAQGYDRVTAMDAESLQVTGVYFAPDGVCPTSVEATGGKVVAGYVDCGAGSGGLAVWSAPNTSPRLFTEAVDYNPVLDTSPGAPGLVVAGDRGVTPVKTFVVDISGDTPWIRARSTVDGSLRDYAMSPDGTTVVQSSGWPYEHRTYRVPDLADSEIYPSGAYPIDAAWSGDGSTVAVARDPAPSSDPDVYLYARNATVPTYVVDFHPDQAASYRTLLVNRAGTRAWVVTSDLYGQNVTLHSFGPAHEPNPPYTDLTITAQVGKGKTGHTATVTATLRFPVVGLRQLRVTASTNGGAEKEILSGMLDENGQTTGTYDLPRGTTTFTARYTDFDGWFPSKTVTTTLTR
ncbi:WD40 repeat domain-containing protein [Actinopolymorpha rutila]|uniref:Uncharacterized protein n=1 Tax=Actinopolymorpha rutila TaxID=446787 RepID=A0A852Z3Y4_9ACTN|nr:WD40 repeat domain-containing protein [Actinopolymorpha rutila]NYH87684.1 hypothetical protein [Actinopolymorpha rutila]